MLKTLREKILPYNERTLKKLVISAFAMYLWMLVWALLLKLANEGLLVTNYTNLSALTLKERIMWDLIPFNYSASKGMLSNLLMDSLLNCFVFAPVGVAFGYLFKKTNLLRDVALCLGLSLFIELLQLLTMLGNPATEDLITNALGYFIGFLLYRLVISRLSLKSGVRFFAVLNAIFAVLTVYALITTVSAAPLIYGIVTRTL